MPSGATRDFLDLETRDISYVRAQLVFDSDYLALPLFVCELYRSCDPEGKIFVASGTTMSNEGITNAFDVRATTFVRFLVVTGAVGAAGFAALASIFGYDSKHREKLRAGPRRFKLEEVAF